MRCNQKTQYVLRFCARCEKQRNKKRVFRPCGKPFFISARFTNGNEKCEPQVCFPATAKTAKQKTRTRFVNNVARKTFPVLSIVAVRIFSQQKHAAVRCVQSSGVSPAALRRCKTAYRCAYSRNKAKKRFVLVQRFMPAYALCRNIIKLYKNQYGRGEHLLGANADIFSQQKHAAVRCVQRSGAEPVSCGSEQSVSACAKPIVRFQTFFARQRVISSCRRVSFYSSISLFMRIHVHNAAIR